jgi:hypothetical protein
VGGGAERDRFADVPGLPRCHGREATAGEDALSEASEWELGERKETAVLSDALIQKSKGVVSLGHFLGALYIPGAGQGGRQL